MLTLTSVSEIGDTRIIALVCGMLALIIIVGDTTYRLRLWPKTQDRMAFLRDRLWIYQKALAERKKVSLTGEHYPSGNLKIRKSKYPIIDNIVLKPRTIEVFTQSGGDKPIVYESEDTRIKCSITPRARDEILARPKFHYITIGKDKYGIYFPPEHEAELIIFSVFANVRTKHINLDNLSNREIRAILRKAY